MKRSNARQQLLGIAAPARPRSTFEDRGFGTTETPQQRQMRLAKQRAVHEAQKYADGASVLQGVRMRRMP